MTIIIMFTHGHDGYQAGSWRDRRPLKHDYRDLDHHEHSWSSWLSGRQLKRSSTLRTSTSRLAWWGSCSLSSLSPTLSEKVKISIKNHQGRRFLPSAHLALPETFSFKVAFRQNVNVTLQWTSFDSKTVYKLNCILLFLLQFPNFRWTIEERAIFVFLLPYNSSPGKEINKHT